MCKSEKQITLIASYFLFSLMLTVSLPILQLLVFSVTPCKIDQNQNKQPFNRLRPESEKRKKVTKQRFSPRFRSQQFSYSRYGEKLFLQINRDLFGDAIFVPIHMGTNMAAGSQ